MNPKTSAPSPSQEEHLASDDPARGRAPAPEAIDLHAENAALRARVTELERTLAYLRVSPSEQGPSSTATPDSATPSTWLAASSRAFLQWSHEGIVTRWSPGAERLFEWRADEALGRKLADLIGAEPQMGELLAPEEVATLPNSAGVSPVGTAQSTSTSKYGRSIQSLWTYAILRGEHAEPGDVAAEVEDVGDEKRAELVLRERQRLLLMVLDNSPSMVFVKDLQGRYILVNRALALCFNKHPMELIGRTDLELGFVTKESAELWMAKDREVIESGMTVRYEETIPMGELRSFVTVKFPIFDVNGEPIGICGIALDITDLKRAEAARAALQEEVIAAQKAALRELSTPLIPLADGIVAMPIVGTVDAVRSRQITEALLQGVSQQRAHTALLDITGVRVVDAEVAGALVAAARAARLLGARVVLTGIRPEVAQALVGLGAELSGVLTLGTLKDGIAYAMRR